MRAKFIFESPDSFRDPKTNKFTEWDMVEYLPVTFGWYKGKLYWNDKIIKRRGEDSIRIKNAEIFPNFFGNKDERVVTHVELGEIEGLEWKDEDGDSRTVTRRQFKYPGRLWRKNKVITFWEFPEKGEMPEVLKELGDAIGEKIYGNPEWKIETNKFEESSDKRLFVSASEYKGSENYSAAELAADHAKSPLLKRPNTSGPGKLRSRTYPGEIPAKTRAEATKYAYTENKKEIVRSSLNENPNAIYLRDEDMYTDWDNLTNIVFSKYGDDKVWSSFNKPGDLDTHYDLFRNVLNKAKGEDEINKIQRSAPNSGRGLCSGRIFPDQKLITFWFFPEDRKEFDDLIRQMNVEYDLGIDDTWEVELPSERMEVKDSGWGDWYPDENSQYFIPVSKYKGGYERPKEEIEQEHEKSPLLKKKKKVPRGIGSNQPDTRRPLKYRQAMYAESLKEESLNENPNAIIDPKEWEKRKDQPSYTPNKIEYDEAGAIPFGYYGDPPTLVIGTSKQTHMHVLNKAKKKDLIQTAGQFKERGRNSGRVFSEQKVISFWNFPKDYNELIKVVKDLETLTGLDIQNDPEWRVEIPSGEFKKALDKDEGSWGSWHPRVGQVAYIPISQYKGGHTRSEDELKIKHTDNPMEKERKRNLLKKLGKSTYGYVNKKGGFEKFKEKYYSTVRESLEFYPRLK